MIRPGQTINLLTALALAGCGPNWQPLAVPTPAPVDPGTVVEFRTTGSLVRLHGVRFTRDSVNGVPWLDHLSCDTCRVSYALGTVTEIRTGHPGRAAWWIMGPLIGVGLAILALRSALSGLET